MEVGCDCQFLSCQNKVLWLCLIFYNISLLFLSSVSRVHLVFCSMTFHIWWEGWVNQLEVKVSIKVIPSSLLHPHYSHTTFLWLFDCPQLWCGFFMQVSSNELHDSDSPWSTGLSEEEQLVQSATRKMKDLLSRLQDQNHSLLLLSPIIHSLPHSSSTRTGKMHHNPGCVC